ncbi:MAG TPA: CmpA/NrtA family ABC transporter substrate-binding protein [Candidatus Didemnitutus sp.]|nr:CmpA/NrtA family ABC transporter substrate-binding protein [Candidatus Didemnitutus sp.]
MIALPSSRSPARLRVGFLPLTDAAPLVVAQELGLYARHGLQVHLSREVGWATVRDKVIFGELDAAPAPAPMLWAVNLGLECMPCAASTAFVFNLHGNAITLSHGLRDAGVTDSATLRAEVTKRRGNRPVTFGVVFRYSSHHLLLREWLRSAQIDPDRDVRIVVVPPAQMFRNLAAGTIDGYCVGEPWNSVAVHHDAGWCPAWSAQLSPGHVEKVLMVRDDFARKQPEAHAALITALAEACAWCDAPENRPALARLLSVRDYLNLSPAVIAAALTGQFGCGAGRVEAAPDFFVFHRGDANAPTADRATALQAELIASGLLTREQVTPDLPQRLFRESTYRDALNSPATHVIPVKNTAPLGFNAQPCFP